MGTWDEDLWASHGDAPSAPQPHSPSGCQPPSSLATSNHLNPSTLQVLGSSSTHQSQSLATSQASSAASTPGHLNLPTLEKLCTPRTSLNLGASVLQSLSPPTTPKVNSHPIAQPPSPSANSAASGSEGLTGHGGMELRDGFTASKFKGNWNRKQRSFFKHVGSIVHLRDPEGGSSAELSNDEAGKGGGGGVKSYGWSIRASTIVSILCALQVCTAVAGIFILDKRMMHQTVNLMQSKLLDIQVEVERSLLEGISFRAERRVRSELDSMALCSLLLSDHCRSSKVEMEDRTGVVQALHSLNLYFNVSVLLGTSDSKFLRLFRLLGSTGAEPGKVQLYSNLYSDTLLHSQSELWVMDLDSEGNPLLDSAAPYDKDYDATSRPWYAGTEARGVANWISPYLFADGESLGIDACAPIRRSGETVIEGVGCCENTLSLLSEKLRDPRLGHRDVSFLVEADGAHSGLLIAAATGSSALPVVQAGSRLSASNYPSELNSIISRASVALLNQATASWDQLMSGSMVVEDLGSKESVETEWGDLVLAISISRLGGEVSDMIVELDESLLKEAQSFLSPHPHNVDRLANMNWILVTVVDITGSKESAFEAQEEMLEIQGDMLRANTLIVVISVAGTLLLSWLAALPVAGTLNQLSQALQGLKQLHFDETRDLEPSLEESRQIWLSFVRMRTYLKVLVKFVPWSVMRMEMQRTGDDSMRTGRLCLEKQVATVLSCIIANFSEMSKELSSADLVRVLGPYITTFQSVIDETGGVLGDFVGDGSISAFWPASEREHAKSACKAASRMQHEISLLNDRWTTDFGVEANIGLQLNQGLHTAGVLIGSYGTMERMKYGAVGEAAMMAARLSALAQTYKTPVLISDSVRSSMRNSGFVFQYKGKMTVDKEVEISYYEMVLDSSADQGGELQWLAREGLSARILREELIAHGQERGVGGPADPAKVLEAGVRNPDFTEARRSRICQYFLRGSVLFTVLWSIQIGLSAGVMGSLGRQKHEDASTLLNSSLFDAVTNMTHTRMVSLSEVSVGAIKAQINQMPKCAELFADDFRTGRLTAGNPRVLERGMHSLLARFDVQTVLYGMSNDTFSQSVGLGSGTILYGTNIYNHQPHNKTGYSDTSVVYYPANDEGRYLIDEEDEPFIVLEGYLPTSRPWYSLTASVGKPTWVPPYLFANETIGIDACVPLYEAGAVSFVGCCENNLEALSVILTASANGARGVAFIVEADGESSGMLVAAATPNRTLPVAINRVRLSANTYEPSLNSLIRFSSDLVLNSTGNWSEVMDQDTFQGEVTLGSSSKPELVIVKVVDVLDPVIDDFFVDHSGRWSSEPYPVAGNRWLLVITSLPADFVDIDASLDQNQRQTVENERVRGALLAVVCVMAVLISVFVTRRGMYRIRLLMLQMQRVEEMDFTPYPFRVSHVEEVRRVQLEFDHMRGCLHRLQRYVSEQVIHRICQTHDESFINKRISCGQPGMEIRNLSILVIQIRNFAEIASLISNIELLKLLDRFLETTMQEVRRLNGVLSDFQAESITVFFEDNKAGDHAVRALLCTERIMSSIADLNRKWKDSFDSQIEVKTVCGLQSGTTPVGNFGSLERLKYGVVGENVKMAQRLATLAKTFNTRVLVHGDAKEQVLGSYLCSFRSNSHFGPLYQLERRAASFDPEKLYTPEISTPNRRSEHVSPLEDAFSLLHNTVESFGNAIRLKGNSRGTSLGSSRHITVESFGQTIRLKGNSRVSSPLREALSSQRSPLRTTTISQQMPISIPLNPVAKSPSTPNTLASQSWQQIGNLVSEKMSANAVASHESIEISLAPSEGVYTVISSELVHDANITQRPMDPSKAEAVMHDIAFSQSDSPLTVSAMRTGSSEISQRFMPSEASLKTPRPNEGWNDVVPSIRSGKGEQDCSAVATMNQCVPMPDKGESTSCDTTGSSNERIPSHRTADCETVVQTIQLNTIPSKNSSWSSNSETSRDEPIATQLVVEEASAASPRFEPIMSHQPINVLCVSPEDLESFVSQLPKLGIQVSPS